MVKKPAIKTKFRGYTSPNYTPVPDELFDEQLPDLSGAELKLLLYIIRRTFGFKKESDNISLNQLLHGITTREGRVLDRGTGLSKKTLLETIKSLIEKNLIMSKRRRSEEKGNEPTTYHLNIVGTKEEDTTEQPPAKAGGLVIWTESPDTGPRPVVRTPCGSCPPDPAQSDAPDTLEPSPRSSDRRWHRSTRVPRSVAPSSASSASGTPRTVCWRYAL